MNPNHEPVAQILADPLRYAWTLQGFGMLRLYLSRSVRLHIWDERFRTADVSDIHDHPWDFQSEIICGRMVNRRYMVELDYRPAYQTHVEQRIVCGPGGGATPERRNVALKVVDERSYIGGGIYFQSADTVHASAYETGTVTIVTRTFREDTEHAKVYHPVGAPWVSAEPRKATTAEVVAITQAAMSRLKETP